MQTAAHSRRRFLVAAVAFAGASMTPASLRLGTAFAQGAGRPGESSIRMARLLLPHSAIGNDIYADVLETAIDATASSLATALDEALADLDAQQSESFMALDEAGQLAALRAVESEAFFATILDTLKVFFYGNPGSWDVMSYEGPSWQKGGYANRGAGVIDWLPEDE